MAQIAVETKRDILVELDLDLRVAICGFLFVCGLYTDGWAHYHGRVDDSFFTPWHAVLYGSFALTAAVISVPTTRAFWRSRDWRRAVPSYYGLAIIGIVVFALGGLGDLVWHTLYGIEEGVEALISPTHLLLVVGGVMVCLGPVRRAWFRPKTTLTRQEAVPIILSATSLLSALTFFTAYLNPFINVAADFTERRSAGYSQYVAQQVGIGGIFVATALTMGVLLLVLNRWDWQLPFGSLTFILTVNALAMVVLSDNYILVGAGLVAGLAGDLMLRRFRPKEHIAHVRLFAFLLPVIFYLTYFAIVMQTAVRFEWSIHMWLGSTFLAGTTGLLLSFLATPPPIPASSS